MDERTNFFVGWGTLALIALASLGLNATASQVGEALKRLPEAGAGMEEPERIRQIFLELRKQA